MKCGKDRGGKVKGHARDDGRESILLKRAKNVKSPMHWRSPLVPLTPGRATYSGGRDNALATWTNGERSEVQDEDRERSKGKHRCRKQKGSRAQCQSKQCAKTEWAKRDVKGGKAQSQRKKGEGNANDGRKKRKGKNQRGQFLPPWLKALKQRAKANKGCRKAR